MINIYNIIYNHDGGFLIMSDDSCLGCKWLENRGTWCDMRCSGVSPDHSRCKDYDNSIRRFEPDIFYRFCKKYVSMYDSFSTKQSIRIGDEVFDYGETELLSFVLNDMKREIHYYERSKLYEDLNKVDLPITQRK